MIACPLLRKIYNDVLDQWYDHDQHFDSPLLDWLREIERALPLKSQAETIMALGMESVFYEFETQNLINMNAREKLDEFAEMTGMNKNQLIGWSIAADFAEWYAEQVKNCSMPDVSKLVLLAKPNYRAKDGTIKQGIEIKGKYYAPQNDC